MAAPQKEKAAEPAGYATVEALASLFGISRQWIWDITKKGIISKHKTAVGQRYHVVEATRAYIKHLQDNAAGRDEQKKGGKEQEAEKLSEEIRLKRAKADIAELEAAEFHGQMHRSEDVKAMTEDLIYTIRGSIMALAGRLAKDVIQAETEAQAAVIIRTEAYKVLEELSQYRYDPAKYKQKVRERQKWADMDDEKE